MSTDVQHFDSDGTWVKLPGAVRAKITLKGGTGGSTLPGGGGGNGGDASVIPGIGLLAGGGGGGAGVGYLYRDGSLEPSEWIAASGGDGATAADSFPADALPDRMDIKVGQGGWAEIVTDLND